MLSLTLIVRAAPATSIGLRKSTTPKATADDSCKAAPAGTKPPCPQVSAPGEPKPPRATTKEAWAEAKPPPAVPAHVTDSAPATAAGARERTKLPSDCRTPTVAAVPRTSGLAAGKEPAAASTSVPLPTVVRPE